MELLVFKLLFLITKPLSLNWCLYIILYICHYFLRKFPYFGVLSIQKYFLKHLGHTRLHYRLLYTANYKPNYNVSLPRHNLKIFIILPLRTFPRGASRDNLVPKVQLSKHTCTIFLFKKPWTHKTSKDKKRDPWCLKIDVLCAHIFVHVLFLYCNIPSGLMHLCSGGQMREKDTFSLM